jgi:hypothetical protein
MSWLTIIEVMGSLQKRWTGREMTGDRERVGATKYREIKADWQMGQELAS